MSILQLMTVQSMTRYLWLSTNQIRINEHSLKVGCSGKQKQKWQKRRFATVGEEELNKLLVEKDAVNTRRNTASAVKLLKTYLEKKLAPVSLENMDANTLDSYLTKFYAEVRMENGQKYKKTSLIAIRHGINRFATSSLSFDIVNGNEFKESKRMFDALCKRLKSEGKGGFEHYPALEAGDMQKLMDYFDINDSTKLLEKVFVDLMIYFGRRGRENMRDLKVDDFAATRDGDGNLYIYMVKDELTKNHQKDKNTAEGRMYSRPDDHMCPVKTFLRYKKHRNPHCSAFFQRPKKVLRDDSGIWYDKMALGHNILGNMMVRISEKAGLSRKYTNHSLRATAVNILDKSQFPSRRIMSVTGHTAESSLKTYSGSTDSNTKKLMSDAISKNLRCEKPAALGQAPMLPALPAPEHKYTVLPTIPALPENVDFLSDEFEKHDNFDDLLSYINTDNFNLVPRQSDKENLYQNNFSQMNNFQNINAVPFNTPFPNIANYGTIAINYNVQK